MQGASAFLLIMTNKFDLHIHSKYSWDCKVELEQIIKISKKKKLQGISITDHDTSEGAFKALKLVKGDDDLTIIPGVEVSTQFGHVIAMFIKEKINTTDFYELIDIAKEDDLILTVDGISSHDISLLNDHLKTKGKTGKFAVELQRSGDLKMIEVYMR